ncbi:MAG TPA: hypothetical protein VH000_01135 [Rhizomicrobium sp.]|jgi:hypothetical protein|nr:hypothetical protein [Rhizomicrobium sp.]
MSVALRFLSLILIVIALMLLGADLITSLEKGGQITVRSLEQVWTILDAGNLAAFKAWVNGTLPQPTPGWVYSFLTLPGWAIFGVVGVILAFLFGRRSVDA